VYRLVYTVFGGLCGYSCAAETYGLQYSLSLEVCNLQCISGSTSARLPFLRLWSLYLISASLRLRIMWVALCKGLVTSPFDPYWTSLTCFSYLHKASQIMVPPPTFATLVLLALFTSQPLSLIGPNVCTSRTR
jgi:hypothetical protein